MGKVEFATREHLLDIQMQYIKREYKNGDFERCYESCDFLLRLLPQDKEDQKKLKRFCYTKQAVCLKKFGRYEEALEKANIAEQYSSKDDYYSVVYMKALIYKQLKDTEKALRCLNKCVKWYKQNNMYYELAKALDTKADLLRSEKLFLEAIENYKLAEKEADWSYIDRDKFKAEFDNVYHRLIDLYIHIGEQNMIKSYKALSNIRGSESKNEAAQKVKDLYRKEV